MAKATALPAWDETEDLTASPPSGELALPAFDDTQAIDPEVMPAGFEPPSKLESFARGGAQGASLGFADEATGGIEALKDYLLNKSDSIGDAYTKHRDESRANYKAAKDANPLTYAGGQVTGGVASALLTPELTAGKMLPVALKLGGMGALQGVGESDAKLLSAKTAQQAALSGLIGAGVGAAGAKLAKTFTNPEALDEMALTSGRRALGFTKKLQNTPLKEMQADDAVRMALDNNVLKPFAEPKAMQEAAEGIGKKSGEAMGDFLREQSHGATRGLKAGAAPQLREQFLFDPQRAISEVESLRPQGLNMGENAKINSIVDNVRDTIKAEGTINAKGDYALRPIPWEKARELKTKIQGMANYDTAASREVNEMKKKLAGKLRESFMGQLEETASSRGADAGFDEFAKNVKNFGSAETLQDALQNRVSSDQGNSVVGLRDAIFGAAELGRSGDLSKTGMVIAGSKVARRYGNQTAAWSADRLSKAIQSSPQVFQKWLPNLRSAMSRGPQALAVTSFILQQTDPDFSKTLEEGNHE